MENAMKKLMMICLLAAGATAMAQSPDAGAAKRAGKASEVADLERDAMAQRADEDKMRAELDEARRRLDEAARQVAELSAQLGRNEGRNFVFVDGNGPRRAVLGVQIDPESGKEGARVLKVSPGGAAEEAGLVSGDVIVALDAAKVAGSDNPNRAVVEHMRSVQPDQKVKVKVLRAGKNKDFVVVARPMVMGDRMFNIQVPDMGPAMAGIAGAMPQIHQFRTFFRGDFGGMELAKITPKLGAYFGASDGVLVVQAPDNAAFKLEDGDVIQSIDGRKPDDGAHALRILRSYKSGEKFTLSVLRQRKPLSLAVVLPERPDFEEGFPLPPDVEAPAMPATPAVPPGPTRAPLPPQATPGGAST
jgi:C-terminal processing protease CtpA/Prc